MINNTCDSRLDPHSVMCCEVVAVRKSCRSHSLRRDTHTLKRHETKTCSFESAVGVDSLSLSASHHHTHSQVPKSQARVHSPQTLSRCRLIRHTHHKHTHTHTFNRSTMPCQLPDDTHNNPRYIYITAFNTD